MNSAVRIQDLLGVPVSGPLCDVSVLMVVFMTGPVLFATIERVLDDPFVEDFVIVDNGSTPADAARLRDLAEAEPRITLLHGHGNIGFARACNLGASQTRGRHIVVLNPDAFLEPGTALSLVRAARAGRAPCIVGARVLNADGTEQRGARRGEVTPVTTLLSFTHLSSRGPLRKFEIHREDDAVPDCPVPVPTISGACFCISRDDYRALGGFDGRYFLHVEDIDLCWRARVAGGEVLFHPGATVVHLGHTSLVEPLFVEFFKGVGLTRYFRKRADNLPRKVLAVALAPLIMAAAIVRPLFWMAKGLVRPGETRPRA